jgi:hypothetical protein
MMGTEIRTFYSMKEMSDSLIDNIVQYKALAEDYSEWLGSLLRSCEENHKNEGWVQKSAAMQKNMRGSPKKVAEAGQSAKKKGEGKSKKNESSCWIQSGELLLCSTEQGEAEILFEAIEEINKKTQALEKFKTTLQQLERIGLGKNVDYIVYIKDDVPERLVLRTRENAQTGQTYKFETDLTVIGINR